MSDAQNQLLSENAKGFSNEPPREKSSARKRMLQEFWFYFSENKGAVIGLWFVVLVLLVSSATENSRRSNLSFSHSENMHLLSARYSDFR